MLFCLPVGHAEVGARLTASHNEILALIHASGVTAMGSDRTNPEAPTQEGALSQAMRNKLSGRLQMSFLRAECYKVFPQRPVSAETLCLKDLHRKGMRPAPLANGIRQCFGTRSREIHKFPHGGGGGHDTTLR